MDLNRAIKLRLRENNRLKSKGLDIDSLIERRAKLKAINNTNCYPEEYPIMADCSDMFENADATITQLKINKHDETEDLFIH